MEYFEGSTHKSYYNKEEGEISEDDDATADESPKSRMLEKNVKISRKDFASSSRGFCKSEFGNPQSYDGDYHRTDGWSERLRNDGRRRRSHIEWDQHRDKNDEDDGEKQSSVSHSKIWENHRQRRASSMRPRSPQIVSRVPVHHQQEGEDDYDQLLKEHRKIQELLKTLEDEEEKSTQDDGTAEEEQYKSDEENLLADIEKLPVSLPAESISEIEAIQNVVDAMEDISAEEDFDEQELRRLALATSARHNKLISCDEVKETFPLMKIGPSSPEDPKQVVVIPDMESEAQVLTPDEVVVVEEDENMMEKQSKDVDQTGGQKRKGSSKSKKAHGKKKKKDQSKQVSKKSSPSVKQKKSLSRKDWHRQQRVLQVLAEKDPDKALQKLKGLFKEESLPAPPTPTGTMRDFKRQNRLPLLNKTQNIRGDKRNKEKEKKELESPKKKPSGAQVDNYEEVEMEIESDKEDNYSSTGKKVSTLETLQLGSDFSQAMQPLSSIMYANLNSAYPGVNAQMPLTSGNAMMYGQTNLIPMPMPVQPPSAPINIHPVPVVQQPPLPPPQPPLPPPPKSPPPPPPPPPPLPSVTGVETLQGTKNHFVSSSMACYQGVSQPSLYPQTAQSSYLSHFSYMSPGSYQTGFQSYNVVASENNHQVAASDMEEKAPAASLGDIGFQLHKLRKLQEMHSKSHPSEGSEDKVVFANFQGNETNKSVLEASVNNFLKQSGKNYYSRNLTEDRKDHQHADYSLESNSFRLSSKEEYNVPTESHMKEKRLSQRSSNEVKDTKVLHYFTDLIRENELRKRHQDAYSPRKYSPSYDTPTPSHSSPSSTSLSPSTCTRPVKRKREVSQQQVHLRKDKWKEFLGSEYEPKSSYDGHSKLHFPPPYIPSSKPSVSNDEPDEVADNDNDFEDEDDVDFLRRQLLTDMIKKRINYNLEKSYSSDSSANDNFLSTGTIDDLNSTEENTAKLPDAKSIDIPLTRDNAAASVDDQSISDGGNKCSDENTAAANDENSKEETDEDPIPPPVVSRVWNKVSTVPEQSSSSFNKSSVQDADDSAGTAHLQSSPSPSEAYDPEVPTECTSSSSMIVQSSPIHSTSSSDSENFQGKTLPFGNQGEHNEGNNESTVQLNDCSTSQSSHGAMAMLNSSSRLDSPVTDDSCLDHHNSKLDTVYQAVDLDPSALTTGFESSVRMDLSPKSSSVSSLPAAVPQAPSTHAVMMISKAETNEKDLSAMASQDVGLPKSLSLHSARGGQAASVIDDTTEFHRSRTSSPLLLRNRQLIEPTAAFNRLQTKHPTMIIPPVHPSVIVPLLSSSDEEDEVLDRSLPDSEMTEAEVYQKKLAHLQKEDRKLCQQKQAILTDQEKLKGLLAKISQYMNAETKYESKTQALDTLIAKLLKQQQITEKLGKAQTELKERSKRMAKTVKDRLLKCKGEFFEKTKSVMGLGQVLMGPNFTPTALRLSQDKNEFSKGAAPSSETGKVQNISEEKQRLKEKERKIAEKLKRLKEISTSIKIQRSTLTLPGNSTNKKNVNGKTFGTERSLDVIRLGGDSCQESVVKQPRRQSILLNDSGTTPNLPKTPRKLSSESSVEETLSKDAKESSAFNKPSQTQIANLCKLQAENIAKVITNLVSSPSLANSDPFMSFSQLSEGDLQSADARKAKQSRLENSIVKPGAYKSPLRCLKAYRFSPFYRTKENLSLVSLSHSHKVNSRCVMCPYDLQGTCNDDNCKQQHPKDYTLTDREILEDLVSYHPQIAGIKETASSKDIEKGIASYVDTFTAKHKGRMVLEELCLILTMEAAKVSGKNQSAGSKRRKWRPMPKKEQGLSIHLNRKASRKMFDSLDLTKAACDKDALIGEDDVRYFSSQGSDVISMEAGVMENPQNTSLWLQLSSRRLSDPNRSANECLDQALNVLARGLEQNRSSSDLWLQYLKLYQRHSEVTDISQFCQMALDYAPSYELWILYLSILTTYQDKEEVCHRALEYLCQEGSSSSESSQTFTASQVAEQPSPSGNESLVATITDPQKTPVQKAKAGKLSHQVFETIINKVALNILSGRYKTALTFLQMILGLKKAGDSITSPASSLPYRLLPLLVGGDCLSLWLVYIYVVEWQQLPPGLMEACSDTPGRLARKDVEFLWSSKSSLVSSLDSLISLHVLAGKVWKRSPDKAGMEGAYVQLIKSLVGLLVSQNQLGKALHTCQKALTHSYLVDVWILYASLYDKLNDKSSVLQTFESALEDNPLNPKLKFHQTLYLYNKGEKDEALNLLEQFVLAHFDDQDRMTMDPNVLFCQLLKQDEGLSLLEPRVKNTVSFNTHKNVYMWLCYCHLLELQGESQDTVELYERSLSHVDGSADLVTVWQSYISYLVRSGLLAESWPDILIRSLISLSTKQPQSFSGSGGSSIGGTAPIIDYQHSNRVIDSWIQILPDSQKLEVIEKCLDFMPGNVTLLLRGIRMCVKMNETRRAYCWCRMVLAHHERPSNLSFWKIATALAHKEGTQSEIEQFLVGEVESMPLAVSAWKDFLLYEVSQEDSETVDKILTHCQQLGVNIEGFVATIFS